jgi:miniconductance mechanosensitive channel
MWVKYEALQAEVFDHLLAVIHRFGLKVFQSPTGLDLQTLAKDA